MDRMRLHLFDLDGTLTDSRGGLYASFRAGLAAIGCDVLTDAALGQFLGTPLPMVFRAVRPDVGQADIQRGMLAFRSHYEREGIYGNHLYPGVLFMLRAVRDAGLKAWVVTSKPEFQAKRVVSLLKIDRLIGGVVGAGVDELDTKTELVARALHNTGIKADQAVMLGDRHYDIIGARENHVRAVGALWGYGSRAELEDALCDDLVERPEDYCARYVRPHVAESFPLKAIG
jgi:phosphoglycolate phosphatase